MSNQPKQPDDPPTGGASPADNPPGQGRNGVPDAQLDQDATAFPTDDRHDTETAASRIESDDKT